MWCQSWTLQVYCHRILILMVFVTQSDHSFEFPLLKQSFICHLLILSPACNWVLLSASWANSHFPVQVGTCRGGGAVWYKFSRSCSLLPAKLSSWHNCSRVLHLPLCLPACLSEWPCRICMVIEVITASSFYLRLTSLRCFIPWVEASGWKTARNHFEDKLQQPTTPVHLCLPWEGWLNMHCFSRTLLHM